VTPSLRHRAGDEIDGWRLESVIAQGGAGEVWRATKGGVRAALKLPLAHMVSLHAFLDEARLAGRIDHPNVIRMLDVGLHGEAPFLVMELLEGSSLAQLNRPARVFPLGFAVGVAAQLLAGLEAAHSLGVVHRDVKPSNIMLTSAGVVKLIDFGIALASDLDRTKTRTGAFRGSFRYCAPEQISGEAIGPPADVFAVGIILYELITGRRLFDQASEAAILGAILFSPIPPLPDGLGAIGEVVLRALLRKPENRYPNAGSFQRALLEAGQHQHWNTTRLAEWFREVRSTPEVRPETASIPEPVDLASQFASTPAVPPLEARLEPADTQRRLETDLDHRSSRAAVADSLLRRPHPVTDPEGGAASPPSRLGPRKTALGAAVALVAATAAVGFVLVSRSSETKVTSSPLSERERSETPLPANPVSVGSDSPTTATTLGPPAAGEPLSEPREPISDAGPPVSNEERRRPETAVARTPTVKSKPKGLLTLDVNPGWAEVTLRGQKLGVTPLVNVALPSGSHTLDLVRSDGTRKKVVVQVKADDTTRTVVRW
jgi:serine/threonine-protein kinase